MRTRHCLIVNHQAPLLLPLIVLLLALALPPETRGASRLWGGSGADDNWSTAGNWLGGLPATGDDAIFGDTDATGVLGVGGTPNNIVDAAYTAVPVRLLYTNSAGFHFTRITAPTLTIRGTAATNIFQVGTGTDNGIDQQIAVEIDGKALVVSNTAATLVVRQTATNGGTHRATLDLRGLESFTAFLSVFGVARTPESSAWLNRPQGTLFLAKTNLINTTGDFTVGHANSNPGNGATELWFGQENTLNVAGAVRTGYRKSTASLAFQPGLVNPTLRVRGSGGTNRLSSWSVADNGSGDTSTGHAATNDLRGGILDVLLDTLYVGKTYSGETAGTGMSRGSFFFDRGLIDVNTVEVAQHTSNNGGNTEGWLHVFGTAQLKVNNNLRLAQKLGSRDPVGNLYVEGGTLRIAGDLIDGGGITTLSITNGLVDLQPVGDTTPGVVSVDTLNWDSGIFTNYGGFSASQVSLGAAVPGLTFGPGAVLAPAGKGFAGTLNINGGTGLKLNNSVLSFDFYDSVGMSDIIVMDTMSPKLTGTVGVEINPLTGYLPNGFYPLINFYGGALVGNAANLAVVGPALNSRHTFGFNADSGTSIDLIIGGTDPVALTWAGDGAANAWNINSAANWNNHTEKFYNWDTVMFDDTGSAVTPVQITGDVYPNAVEFNNSAKSYILSGSGRIAGNTGITNNNSGSVQILTTNVNTGPFQITAGSVTIGDGATADGGLGAATIVNDGTLTWNPAATQFVAAAISGTGTLAKAGPGITVLSRPNTYTGLTIVTNGVLRILSSSALGATNGSVIVTNGGTLDLPEVTSGLEPILVSGAGYNGMGALIDSSPFKTTSFISQTRDVTLVGDTTFGGTDRWDIRSAATGDPGLRGNGFKLTKISTNTVAIVSGNNNYWDIGVGEIDIRAGMLAFEQTLALGDPTKTLTIRSNATLQLYDNRVTNLVNKPIVMEHVSTINFAGPNPGTGTNVFVGTINTTGTNNINCSNPTRSFVRGPISGTGAIQKGGNGVIQFTAANTYTGYTLINAGTFALGATGSIAASAGINVASGAILDASELPSFSLVGTQTLSGAGVVTGSVTIASTAFVRPGATLGTLSFSNNLTMAGTTFMEINKSVTGTNDRIAVAGSLSFGGNLVITNLGPALVVGDKFTLFSKPGSGSFASIVYPSGYYFTNKLDLDGTIEVTGLTTPTTGTNLTYSVSGNTLTLQWPSDYLGWTAQSNSVDVADGASWYDIPGSATQTSLVVTVVPGTPKVFYRLRYLVP